MKTYRSSPISRIRKTLQKLELEIARVECEIAVCDEIMSLYSASTKQADIKKFLDAKIKKDNYQVFHNRLGTYRQDLLRKVSLVAEKYQGDYAGVFEDFFMKKLPIEEISTKYNLSVDVIWKVVNRINKELKDVDD